MPTLTEYEDWKAGLQKSSIGAANVVLSDAQTVNPDQFAGDIKLGKAFGLPAGIVAEGRDGFAARLQSKRNETILKSSPLMASWLGLDDNAKVAHDDLENLSWFEAFGNQAKEAAKGIPGGAVSSAGTALEGAGQLLTPRSAEDRKPIVSAIATAGTKTPDEIAALRQEIFKQGVVNPTIAQSILSDVISGEMTPDEAMQALEPAIGPILSSASQNLQAAGEKLQNDASSILPATPGMEDSIGRQVGSGLGSFLTILATAAATGGVGAGVLSGLMGAGEATANARQAGQDEDTQTIAGLYGILPGLTDVIPVERFLNNPATRHGVASLLRSVGIQALTEGGQEGVQQIMQNAIAQNLYAPDKDMLDQVFQSFTTGGLVGALVEAGKEAVLTALPGRVRHAQSSANKAEEAQVTAEKIAQAAQASKLKQRLDGRFMDWVNHSVAGSPVENVYVPAEAMNTYFQGARIDPEDFLAELPGASMDEFRAALATGGDLKIPTGTYAAKIAGSEFDPFLRANMRFDPDAMTLTQAKDFNERVADIQQEAFQEAENQRLSDEELRSHEAVIYDEMVSRLRAAGRATDVATNEAMVWPAFYRSMAERSGLTTEELLQAFPLPKVEGARPEGLQPKNVDELTRTLAMLRGRSAGAQPARESLLEFIDKRGGINDPGGELAARDAEIVKRGKGKKSLRLRRGVGGKIKDMFGGGSEFGMDSVAQAAVESGYLSDDPRVQAWKNAVASGEQAPDITAALLDAIDGELAGKPSYSQDQIDERQKEKDAALDNMEEWLSRRGISLEQSDEEIRAAIEAQEAEEGRKYGQVSPDQARAIDMPVELPTDPKFAEAVANTPGAKITDDGLLIDLVRFQKEEQTSSTSVRTGVFYLPVGSANVKHYRGKTDTESYGGRVEVKGETLIKRPLFVKGATGGKAPEAAFDAIKGKGAMKKLDSAVMSVVTSQHMLRNDGLFEENVSNFLEEYGADSSLAYEIIQNSKKGNQLRYALQENIIAHAAREAGYDAVVGYSMGRNGKGAFLSEVFDVREIDYPTPGETATLHPQFERGRLLFQSGNLNTEADADFIAAEKIISEYTRGNVTAAQARKQVQAMGWDVGPDGFRKRYDEIELISPDGSSHRTYGQSGNLGPRGQIQFPAAGIGQGDTVINLFEKANLSTFLHESGHMFLSVTQAIASGPNAPSDVVGMFDTVKAWWRSNAADVARDAHTVTGLEISAADVEAAIDNGTTGDAAKDSAIDVGMQEQFARGFEAYMMEGKSPSIELRSAFERFRAWLLNIYKRVVNLGVNVSPEIRTVFDRMLASDAEIERARTTVDDEMIFKTAAEAGISEDQFKELAKLHNQAQDEAKQKLLKEAMAPVQREREKWFKDEKAKVREEVEKDVNGQRAYRALEWLGNRRWLGEGKPEDMPDMRMSKDMLVEQYGEGVLKTLPRGKFTVYTVEGGMDPDEVAGWFGYNSGDELVKALETAPARKDAIEAETDRLMRERHGDVLRDGSVEEAALEAVHGDKRGQYLAAELKTLKALAGDTSADITMQDAREIARRTLNRMQVRDAINSRRYLAAERRHADDVIRLSRITTRERMRAQDARRDVGNTARAGIRSEDASALEKTNTAVERANVPTGRANEQTAELVKAARNRLVNHSLYAESVKIADEVEKAERFVGKLSKRSTRDRLAGDYLEAIDEILERYDFRRLSARAETRRGALLAYVERMTEDGRENELSIPDYVIAEAKRTPYKQLSVEYLRGVVDTLKNIEHTARLKRKLIDAKRERDLDATVDGILGSFNGNVKGKPPARTKSGRNPIRSGIGQYINLVKNADTILREIDGFKDGGTAYQAIKAPIDEQHAELIVQRREAAEKFEELYSAYSRDERRNMAVMKSVPELGGQFSKWDLISIALNTGNEDNFQRMTDRRVEGSFTPEQVTAAMARLNAKDADFVQSVWDLVNSYWPQIEARERRISGVAPEKVQARPVTIGGKELAGGYYPLKYDSELSSIASDDEAVDLMQNMKGGRFGKAQTRNGHLKERAKSSGKPVMIDIGVLHGHINQVIHDLALSEVVNNSWKILQDRRVKDAFINTGKKADFDTLEIWLQDVATGEMKPADIFNKLARRARSGFTVSKLALNISTVFLQPTGTVQTMVVVGKKNFALGVTDLFRYDSTPWKSINAAAADVMAMSPFMRERQSTFQKDIYDILGDTRTGPTEGRASRLMREVIAPLGFWTMQKAQFYTADLPTWFGGYRKAIADGASHEDAIARADRVVARAQGSGIFSDRSAIERGSLSRNVRQQDTVRLFTALGSYMFAKFNVAYEKTAQTDFTDPRAALIWASDMALLFTVEAVLYALVHNQLPGGDDDEEGWGEFLLEETALSVMGTLPFFREAAGALQGFNGGGAYGSVMDTLAKPFIQARQGELDVPFVKSVVNLAGMTLMLPSTQINRVIEATWGKNSDDQSPMEWIRRASIGGK